MPIIDRYKQIQTNLAKKKEQKQNLQLSEEQARLATEKFGAEKVNKALETVQNAGVGIENTATGTILPPKAPEIVNNGPTTNETVPQAPITPEPTPTPVVEPIKEEVKKPTPTEQPKPTETPKETPKVETPVVPPKGFEYGSVIDPKTGQPQLVSTAEVKRQKELKKNASIYTSGQALYDGIKSGSILPGTDAFSDLQQANPQVFAEYEALKKQEEAKNKINNVGKIIMGEPVTRPESSTLQDLLDKVSSGLDEDIMTQYKNMVTNNEEYVAANKKVTDLSTELATVENQMNVLGDDMRKKITGETPESVIASKIAREAKPLLDKATFIQNQLEIAKADANRIMADNKAMFELQMADRADKRNLAFQLYGTIRAEEIRMEDIARKDEELKMQMEQAKTQQEYEMYKDQRDYNLKVAQAKSEEEQFYAKLEADKQEKARAKATDFLKFSVTNEDGTTTEMYRNIITGDVMTPGQVFGDTPSTQSGGNPPISEMYSLFSPEGQALLSVPDGTVIPTRLGEVSPQNASIRGKECAEFVNDVYGDLLPKRVGSTYQEKLAVCDEKTGGVGSVAAWKPQGSGEFGHVGIIVDEDAENYYVKSSNYTPGTVTTVAVPRQNINNFYTPESIKDKQTMGPVATKYANGNVRTPDGTLYTKKEVDTKNKEILANDNYKAILTSQDLDEKLRKFEQAFKKHGTEMGPLKYFNQKGRTELQATYQQLILTAKEFFNLGVLNGPDLAVITAGLPSPVAFNLPSSGGEGMDIEATPFNSRVQQGIDSMREMIRQKLKNDYNTVNTTFGDFRGALPALSNADRVYKGIGKTVEESDVEEYLNQ